MGGLGLALAPGVVPNLLVLHWQGLGRVRRPGGMTTDEYEPPNVTGDALPASFAVCIRCMSCKGPEH